MKKIEYLLTTFANFLLAMRRRMAELSELLLNISNIRIKIFSSVLKFKPRNFILRIRRAIAAFQIIGFIIIYYVKKTAYYLWITFKDAYILKEIRSFLVVILFSFFVYYFIVVELSVWAFGYSLLCYWFLFILVMACLISAWRLEAEFLKDELTFMGMSPVTWVHFYKGRNPLSFYDYLTDYKDRPLFWQIVVWWNIADVEEGRMMLFTFFAFLIFFFFYSCVYRFDPHFVKFVAQYFHPIVNFFESWRNPRLEDFISATVRFWTRLVYVLDTNPKYKDSETYNKIKALTRPSPRIEDRAHLQWGYKTSLWKRIKFNDIFFLWNVFVNSHLRPIVFQYDQPIISATRFDPNWKILFLRFMTDRFSTTTENYWKTHFYNDSNFWNLITSFKQQLDADVDKVDWLNVRNFKDSNKFSSTFFELLIAENYFNGWKINSKPAFERYGLNWDYYENLLVNNQIQKLEFEEQTKDIFSSSAYFSPPFSLSGLWSYNMEYRKKYLKKKDLKKIIANKLYNSSKVLNLIGNSLPEMTLEDYSDMIDYDLDVPLYAFETFENFKNLRPGDLRFLLRRPIKTNKMYDLYNWYNHWISQIEDLFNFTEKPQYYKQDEYISLGFLSSLINNWIWNLNRLITDYESEENIDSDSLNVVDAGEDKEEKLTLIPRFLLDPDTYQDLPTIFEVKHFFYKYLNPYHLLPIIERKFLSDTLGYKEKDLKNRYEGWYKSSYLTPTEAEVEAFIEMETNLWELEFKLGMRTAEILKPMRNITNEWVRKVNNYPWYVWTLQYFTDWEYHFVLPGFVWYYYPAPYPTPFSTFGMLWNRYQFFRKNTHSSIVGYSDSIAELWNSTPLALYSGVEAILYFKPLFDFFDYIIRHFINLINYPIEVIITQEFVAPLNSLLSLIFFAHFVWFIHFYIYIFIFCYFFYYFLRYHYHKMGFVWFYERMFEEIVISSYSNKRFWHTTNDIWLNYRTPEQLILFSVHTNLLLHYTFFNYSNFYFLKNNWTYPIVNLIIKMLGFNKKFRDFSTFSNYFTFVPNGMIEWNNFFIFRSFFNVNCVNFKPLLFTGGIDCSLDHLIWSYYEYLNHISLYISWGLIWNSYKLTENTELTSLMKTFTVLIGSTSLLPKFYLLSQPILDSLLARKVFLNLIYLFETNYFLNKKCLLNDFLFSLKEDVSPFLYTLFQTNCFEYYNYNINSGLQMYEYFDSKLSLYLTKINTTTFWNDKWYWFLAFFWSFWFLPKHWFIGGNIHLSYETTRLRLAWLAYSNSWIGQSTYVWPYFNLIQHIWWTSRVYIPASSIISSTYNLNSPGLSVLDNVWNFTEKWYSKSMGFKVETIFGFVRSIDLEPYYIWEKYGYVPYENKNFDLSFPDSMIDKITTNWGYLKTNPVLNVNELGITPIYLIKLFLWAPKSYFWLYLTFYNQLYYILTDIILEDWKLENEYKRLKLADGVFRDFEHEFYAKYDFYIKEFDFLLDIASEKISRNWTFSFDCSFFLSHFVSWDFFSWEFSNLRPNVLKQSFSVDQEITSTFISNLDMIAKLRTTDNWLLKPFGLLDKFEIYTMWKYKSVKILDEKSFSWTWEDIFSNLDREHTVSEVGLSAYPKDDPKNLAEAYTELYPGFWSKWFPYNPALVHNSVSPILVGWVGTLVSNTVESLNFSYSLLYASPAPGVDAWKTVNELVQHTTKLGGTKIIYESFFGRSVLQQQLFSRAFSWLNVILHTSTYWYSFGPKALARNDYWSWKVGMVVDYKNGLYSYRPYLGFRHALGSRLTSYDNLYGYYRSYRQIDDNPLVIDHSTDAVEHLKPVDDETFIEDLKYNYRVEGYETREYEPEFVEQFNMPYREVYYSFQHPYFIGYLLFWVFVYCNYFNYLGIINSSFWRSVAREFIVNNGYLEFNFKQLIDSRQIIESWFWKQMFKYWIFYVNPILLVTSLDCSVDDEVYQSMDLINNLQNFFFKNCFLFSFLTNAMWFTISDISFILDFKKIYNNLFLINWLSLDTPFAVNPYLTTSHHRFFWDDSLLLKFYWSNFFVFSWHSTVNENFNFNLFFDWTNCSFLDTINLISYVGTYRGSAGLAELFFDNPSFIAAFFAKYSEDKSSEVARGLWITTYTFNYSDLVLGSDIALNNFCLVEFFQESLDFLLAFENRILEKRNTTNFLKFYFETWYFEDWAWFSGPTVFDAENEQKFQYLVNSWFAWLKQFLFVYNLQKNLTYDSLIVLFATGLLFTNWFRLALFYKTFWFRLFTRYSSIYFFYKRIGFSLGLFFLKKK